MRKTVLGLTLLVALAAAPLARADTTLGTTTKPAGASEGPCSNTDTLAQLTDTAASPYLVSPPGGTVTGWQINTAGSSAAGGSVTFLVLRVNGSAGTADIVASDTETLPNPLPASGVASFTLPTPVPVTGGETFGLYSPSPVACFFYNSGGSSVPTGNTIDGWPTSTSPTAGQTLTGAFGASPAGYEMNLAVTLGLPQVDAGVTTSALPTTATTTGTLAVLPSVVTNAGTRTGDITFTDMVPAGLAIQKVIGGPGTCTTSGQTVTCTISGLPAGQQASFAVVVSGASAGTYTNQVTVSPNGADDPVTSNNTASAQLRVTAPPAPPRPPARHCTVPRLTGTPSGIAKRILAMFGCKIGKISTSHNRLAKGTVIRTKPGAGTYAVNRKIAITVSSGPKPKKKRRKH